MGLKLLINLLQFEVGEAEFGTFLCSSLDVLSDKRL